MTPSKPYSMTFTIRWTDIDPNWHARHTVYSDCATQVRVSFMGEHGFPVKKWAELGIGPVVLSEQIDYFKEVTLGESMRIDLAMAGLSASRKRFRLRHQIYKEDGSIAVRINMTFGWIDLKKRKMIVIDDQHPVTQVFSQLGKTEDFVDGF